jgi:hypothetical protein
MCRVCSWNVCAVSRCFRVHTLPCRQLLQRQLHRLHAMCGRQHIECAKRVVHALPARHVQQLGWDAVRAVHAGLLHTDTRCLLHALCSRHLFQRILSGLHTVHGRKCVCAGQCAMHAVSDELCHKRWRDMYGVSDWIWICVCRCCMCALFSRQLLQCVISQLHTVRCRQVFHHGRCIMHGVPTFYVQRPRRGFHMHCLCARLRVGRHRGDFCKCMPFV